MKHKTPELAHRDQQLKSLLSIMIMFNRSAFSTSVRIVTVALLAPLQVLVQTRKLGEPGTFSHKAVKLNKLAKVQIRRCLIKTKQAHKVVLASNIMALS